MTFTGRVAFFGRFQSLTVSLRDATETYLELGQRIPIYLNGEIQIAWVLEQGLVDMGFIVRTFGIKDIRRDQVIARGPRFHVAFDVNAADRVRQTPELTNNRARGTEVLNPFGQVQGLNQDAGGTGDFGKAQSKGRYEMMRCKVDSVSLGVMPGRRVAAVRWEGVSEGITFVNQSIQSFKTASNAQQEDAVGSRNTTEVEVSSLITGV